MVWDGVNRTGSHARYADLDVVRFVARNYYASPDRSKVHFLDVGSGRHAPHTRYLEGEGFTVTAIDFSTWALAHIHEDICRAHFGEGVFDCVLDFNTLCHVPNPPIHKIKTWLKAGGKFFSVAPCDNTGRAHLAGKGFVRCMAEDELHSLYHLFQPLTVGTSHYVAEGEARTSWVIEGTK